MSLDFQMNSALLKSLLQICIFLEANTIQILPVYAQSGGHARFITNNGAYLPTQPSPLAAKSPCNQSAFHRLISLYIPNIFHYQKPLPPTPEDQNRPSK